MTKSRLWMFSAFALACAVLTPTLAAAQTKVTLALEWLVSGRHVGFFAAKENGYYRDEGLDVTIERGYGSSDTAKRVATGGADFGIVSVATVIQAIADANAPIQLVATFFNDGPEAILALKSSNIRKPSDLSGKRIGSGSTSSSLQLLPALVKHVDVKDFKIVKMSGDQIYPALLSRNVDAITGFTDNATIVGPVAKKQGDDVVVIPYSAYGVDNYGSGIVVNVDRVKAKDPVIGKFLRATLKGIAWAVENPEKAVAILKKYVPTADESIELQTWKIDRQLIITNETKQHGLGSMVRTRMESTYDMVKTYLGLKNSVPIDKVYTTEFLPLVKPPSEP